MQEKVHKCEVNNVIHIAKMQRIASMHLNKAQSLMARLKNEVNTIFRTKILTEININCLQAIQLKNNFNTSNLISTKKEIKGNINQKKNFQLEYLEIADASTLKIPSEINPKKTYRAFICVRVNDIRLIDNILLN